MHHFVLGLLRSRAFEFQTQLAQLIDQSLPLLKELDSVRIFAVDVLYSSIIRLFIPNYIYILNDNYTMYVWRRIRKSGMLLSFLSGALPKYKLRDASRFIII